MPDESYESARVAVDACILTIRDKSLHVLLHTREKPPFKGRQELPGGLLRTGETAEMTIRRKLLELTGRDDIYLTQFHTFTDPERDPRQRTVSIGFLALVDATVIEPSGTWTPYENAHDLAFDHARILQAALKHLRENLNPDVVRQFMPETFPLNQLQTVYETIEGKRYDNRNFRKRMISSGIIKETQEREHGVSHRPARLFRFA